MASKGYFKDSATGRYIIDFQFKKVRVFERTEIANEREIKALVEKRREEVKDRVRNTLPGSSGPITIHGAFNRYYDEISPSVGNAPELRADLDRVGEFLSFGRQLESVTTDDISKLVSWRRGHYRWGRKDLGLISAAQINKTTWQLVRRVMFRARDEWDVSIPKMPRWKVFSTKRELREPVERIRELLPEEFTAIWTVGSSDPDYFEFFVFLCLTGLRVSEALLKWSQVDMSGRRIIKTGKGGERVYKTLAPQAFKAIAPRVGHDKQYVFTYAATRTTPEKVTHGTIIPAKIAGRRYAMTVAGFNSWWARIRAQAAEQCPSLLSADRTTNFRVHDARHTFATNLLRETGNLKLVQTELGHKNLKTTGKYAHVRDDDRRIAGASAESSWLAVMGLDKPKLLTKVR